MALITVEVIGKPLILQERVTFQVGERFGLDSHCKEFKDMIERGWVRICPSPPSITALTNPVGDKQITRKKTRRKGLHV